MIKAVIFDCFGVLVSEGWLPFKTKHFGHDESLMQEATDLNAQANSGLIGFDDLEEGVAILAQIPLETAKKEINSNPPDEELFAYISSIKTKYKLGILSNAADDWLEKLMGAERLALFDGIVLSYSAGVMKPQPQAYELIAERLGVKPEECVFVDDQERYCAAATETGMKAVWHKDTASTKAQLEQILKH